MNLQGPLYCVQTVNRSAMILYPSIKLVFSVTQHSKVEHNILTFIPTSASIKLHMYTSKTIMRVSLVVQYMLWMYLDQAITFLNNIYPSEVSVFFHIVGNKQSLGLNTTPLAFLNNTAGVRGSVLYGGLLQKCGFTSDRHPSALELFNILQIHKDNVGYSISSDPTQLCFCDKSEKSNCCEKAKQSRSILPGQQVMVSVLAIDQSGSTISTLIHTKVYTGNLSETISYETGSNCTSRNFP